MKRESSYWKRKSIRDPLYGFIGLSERELKIINSEAFLRLNRIKQLSHTYLVYPSAVHTRYEHALGTMHVADRICINLDLDDNIREIVRCAALLHDIGHGPFSHLFENVLQKIDRDITHEDISRLIIKNDNEISSALNDIQDNVIDVLRRKFKDSIASDIISSGLDADKLDYLRRDSYHLGVAYGIFDLERILHTITKSNHNRLCVYEKGKDALENYRLGRYLMHMQVYEHHTRIVADQMFIKALELALDEGIIDKDVLRSANNNFLDYYMKLDDYSIYKMVIENKPNSKAAELLKDIQGRRLLKRACELDPDYDIRDAEKRKEIIDINTNPKRKEEITKEIANKANINDSDRIIIHLSTISIKLYGDELLVLRYNNNVEELSRLSPITANPKTVTKFYVFCPKNKREEVKRATYEYFSIK